jgi:hypothetical protein
VVKGALLALEALEGSEPVLLLLSEETPFG